MRAHQTGIRLQTGLSLMGYLHCRILILIPILIWAANQMATLYYVELFTLLGVRFRLQS